MNVSSDINLNQSRDKNGEMSCSVPIPMHCSHEISDLFERFTLVAIGVEVHAFTFKKFATCLLDLLMR